MIAQERRFQNVGVILGPRRWLGQGAGETLDLRSTSELLPGDRLRIEFPFGSAGYLKFGGSETFTVVSQDSHSVVIRDEGGEDRSFDAGTKEDLLRSLSKLTRFYSVVVTRPSAPPAVSPEQEALIRKAREMGVPSGFVAVTTGTFKRLKPGDYIVEEIASVTRLLQVIPEADQDMKGYVVIAVSGDMPESFGVGMKGQAFRTHELMGGEILFVAPEAKETTPPLVYVGAGVVAVALGIILWNLL